MTGDTVSGNVEREEPGEGVGVSRRTVLAVVGVAAAAATVVALLVTPTGFADIAIAPTVSRYRAADQHLIIDSYRFNEDVNQVTVSGSTSLPAGAVVVVEVGERVKSGESATEATATVGADGRFEAKISLPQIAGSDVLRARAAFDPRWKPNSSYRDIYGDSGEYLRGPDVITGDDAKQLYDDRLLFRTSSFVAGGA